MLLDANVLLYANDARSPHHDASKRWVAGALQGGRRVGIPWQTIGAFTRISTHPRIFSEPLSSVEAWRVVEDWLASPAVWVPPATETTARVYADLVGTVAPTGNLVTDAQLGALALEHGLTVISADSDFARFPEVRWTNPLA